MNFVIPLGRRQLMTASFKALNVEIQNTSMQIISLGKTDPGTMSERAQQLANISNCNFFHLN